jgi:hypothetical protein
VASRESPLSSHDGGTRKGEEKVKVVVVVVGLEVVTEVVVVEGVDAGQHRRASARSLSVVVVGVGVVVVVVVVGGVDVGWLVMGGVDVGEPVMASGSSLSLSPTLPSICSAPEPDGLSPRSLSPEAIAQDPNDRRMAMAAGH